MTEVFLKQETPNYDDNLSICLGVFDALCRYAYSDHSAPIQHDLSEERVIEFLSYFIIGSNFGDVDLDMGIGIARIATSDTIYDNAATIEYEHVRGPHGTNVIIFQDIHNTVIAEEKLILRELIKYLRDLYKKEISKVESAAFMETCQAIARKYDLGDI